MQVINLFILSALTLIVNTIFLSAILYRIGEWGITPNRLAVLVSNVLIFSNLVLLAFKLFRVVRKKALLAEAEDSIALFVVFLFPVIFGFK